MKNARRKLKITMPATLLCKTPANCRGETCRSIGKRKTKHASIVDADEHMRIRLEGVPHRYHEDHISAKGINSKNHYISVPKFFRCFKHYKIPDAKAAVEKEWGAWRKIPARQLTKARNKKDVIEEARNKGRKVHFASVVDLCHLKNSELEPQYQKSKGRVVLRGDIVRDDSGSYTVFKDHQHHKWRQQKSWTFCQDYWDAQDKQQMRYPLTLRTKWKMHRRYWKFQSQNVQIFGYVYQNTNGQNHGPVWKTQLFLLTASVRWSLGRTGMGTAIWEVCVFDFKLAGKMRNFSPTWKILMKDVDVGEPTSFLDHVYLGCTQRECQISMDIVENCRCSNQGFLLVLQKNWLKQSRGRNLMLKRYLHGPTTWKVMRRNVWKDIANLRKNNWTMIQKSQHRAWMTIN